MKLSTTQLVLAPDAVIDLQLHTTYSDGAWVPEQLIDYLLREGFGLAAITDHDCLNSIETLQQLASQKRMPLLVATEMTASWRGKVTDVLCYGFDPENTELNDLAQDILRRQQANTREVYENIRREDYVGEPQDSDELMTILEKPAAQQPHELVAVVEEHGLAGDGKSLGRILDDAGFHLQTNPVAAVVDAAHQAGGVCLIAHPGRRDGFVCYDVDLLDQLRQEVPIDGLEVHYPAHSPEQVSMFREYARKHRLLSSSGSDSHGPDKPPIKYPVELSRSLLERLGIQVK